MKKGSSHADILRTKKSDLKRKELSTIKILKSTGNTFFLKLDVKTDQMRLAVVKKLEDEAQIVPKIDTVFKELRNLNKLTGADQICEGIISHMAYRGIQAVEKETQIKSVRFLRTMLSCMVRQKQQ